MTLPKLFDIFLPSLSLTCVRVRGGVGVGVWVRGRGEGRGRGRGRARVIRASVPDRSDEDLELEGRIVRIAQSAPPRPA